MAIKPVYEVLNIEYTRQFKNLKNDTILVPELAKQPMQILGDNQIREYICLSKKLIYGWLFRYAMMTTKHYKCISYNVITFFTTIFIRDCETYLNVDNLLNHEREKVIKTCTYKWKDYAEGVDSFEVRTNKHIGQPLVFRRNDFLSCYEIKTLYPAQQEETKLDFSEKEEAKETPF